MPLVFQRRLAIPLWAVAFFTVAFMPLTTVFTVAAFGVAAIVFMTPGAIAWLRASRALVRVVPSGYPDPAGARIVVAAGAGVRKLDEPHAITVDDALDLVRMDDDGGWQMPRPPA